MSTKTLVGPLLTTKTITVTFVPDWSQEEMHSPLRAASICVVLGPANTLPQQAMWLFEFNLFATDKPPSAVRSAEEESIDKNQRALLWYEGHPYPKYKSCVVNSKCRLPGLNDDLKTQSIVVRTHSDEHDPQALIWVRKRGGPKRRKDLSYLKVFAGHHYYLNITFAAGSTIAQLVSTQSWRPIVYLYAKRQKKGIDEIQSSRLFTNFTTNWSQGIESNVDERETKLADEEVRRAQAEDSEDRAQAKSFSAITSQPPHPSSIAATDSIKEGCVPSLDMKVTTPPAIDKKTPNSKPTHTLYQISTRSDCSVDYIQLETAINSKPIGSIILPPLPSLEGKPHPTDLSLDWNVLNFVKLDQNLLAHTLNDLESAARTLAADTKSAVSDVAKHLLNCLGAVSQLSGWQHVQSYIQNPQLYIERTESNQAGKITAAIVRGPSAKSPIDAIDALQMKGESLIRRLIQRIDWILSLQRKAKKQFDAELYIKVISSDREWFEDVNAFMKEAESKVTEMLAKHPPKFHAFRELQRKGVQWPHSHGVRNDIHKAGFVYRPMMIKRDRCICETCGVEVSGWRPWHNPWSFHNYSKHPPSFQREYFHQTQLQHSVEVENQLEHQNTAATQRSISNAGATGVSSGIIASNASVSISNMSTGTIDIHHHNVFNNAAANAPTHLDD